MGTLENQHQIKLLQTATIDAWDGTDASARALLAIVHGLKQLQQQAASLGGKAIDHT
ncbi:MAG: hypothetical protein NZ772_11190 [Cyanobacteria bacterium]|nr:hypothetical protein [Cyanobacteriota bacterium]MDW8201893.1 hypothetical protein [Cyanobacteriota bacterium SKYGB_h_bin112]